MARDRIPATNALRALKAAGVEFVPTEYRYEDKGGTAVAARELKVDEHQVIKTLVMHDQDRKPLIVLMHGDREVSTRQLARIIGVKTVTPCDPAEAQRLTGYMVGGISPFGLRTSMPVYVEETILDLPRICINGGRRGLLVQMSPLDAARILEARPVRSAV